MDSDILNLLSVTGQQFELLRAVDVAVARGRSKPKDIEEEYHRLTSKAIQRPNLFAQLRELEKRELITKNSGTYNVNKVGLKHNIIKHKEYITNQIKICQAIADNLDKFFKSAQDNTTINYFSSEEFYRISSETLKVAKMYYRISNMPSVTAPDASQRYFKNTKDYAYTILSGCRKGTLQVKYIISMAPNRMFLRAIATLNNKEAAYKEVEEAYENLIRLLDTPNLQFRYLDANIESVGIIESDNSSSFWLPLRTSVHDLMGGIAIENSTVCEQYKNMFNRLWNIAAPLTKELTKKVAKEKLKLLKRNMDKLIGEVKQQ